MEGQLRIHRGGGFADRARAYKVLVDDKLAAEVQPNETTIIPVCPGDHVVQLKIDWCSSKKLEVRVSKERPTEISCRGRNPIFALYWVTVGRNEYIQLEAA